MALCVTLQRPCQKEKRRQGRDYARIAKSSHADNSSGKAGCELRGLLTLTRRPPIVKAENLDTATMAEYGIEKLAEPENADFEKV